MRRAEFLQSRCLFLSWVLQRRVSCRDSTSCPWNSTEAEFPLEARVALVVLDYFNPTIVQQAFLPKLDIQHHKKRKRSMPTLN
jgi:hypothetical protein